MEKNFLIFRVKCILNSLRYCNNIFDLDKVLHLRSRAQLIIDGLEKDCLSWDEFIAIVERLEKDTTIFFDDKYRNP